jgi:hypothetical protein
MEHIESMLGQHYMKEYTKKRASFKEDLQLQLLSGKVTENGEVNKMFPADIPNEYKGPSITIIRYCFIYDFEKKQHLYTCKMIEHSAEWISIDHTFKIAANIGANRKCDSHWEKQYDSMICVMNEIGCVIAWQLTLGTAFDKVEDLLKGLHSRFQNQGRNVKLCFTDNCCTWKRKLQSVFGKELNVKLDLFHAVQRVVNKISKRHPFSFNCAQAFSLILRQPHDHGESRKENTPDPETMNKQLDNFVLTWKDVIYLDKPVLTLDALKEIKNLREHINKGCLSNIPPGCGTERNENLHKCIRKSASKVRIGVHLAVALFTTFLYVWNEKRKNADRTGKKTKFLPIFDIDNAPSPWSTKPCSKETFGMGVSSERRINSKEEKLPPSYCDLFSDCNWDAEGQNLDEILNNSDFKLGKEDVKKILDRASNIMSVVELLEACNGRNRTFNTEHAHLISNPALFAFGTCIDKTVEEKESLERLQNTLASYNMELVNSSSDGDCLFTSIIFGLKQIVSSGKYEKYNEHLKNLNLCFDLDISLIVLHLRNLLVSEWLANASEYEDFVTSQEISFEELANSYRGRGVFAGELGNIMAVGLGKRSKNKFGTFHVNGKS